MLYADLTIFFVNVVQIVAHFHIKYREKVYIFLGSLIIKNSITKKVVQINSTVKVSSTFSKVAGSRGGAPRRPSAIVNKVYCEIPFYPSKTEQGVRNAKAFRGEA